MKHRDRLASWPGGSRISILWTLSHTIRTALSLHSHQSRAALKNAVHVVIDNLSAHKAAPVAEWLAHPRRARWHLHFTPTSSSWLNLVESWFSQLTSRRLKRGVFSSVVQLEDEIGLWAEHWNNNPTPFIWKKPADEIIAKVRRGRAALVNSVTDH